MEKPSVKCALLATMIAKHKWGTPISQEDLLNLSAIDGDYPTALDLLPRLKSWDSSVGNPASRLPQL